MPAIRCQPGRCQEVEDDKPFPSLRFPLPLMSGAENMNSTSPLPLMDKASSFHKITDCQGWKKPGNSSLQPLSPGPIIDALGFRCHLQAGPLDWNLWPKNLPGASDHTPCGFVDTSVWVSIDTSHSTMSPVQSTISAHKPVLPGEPSPQCPQPSHLITYLPRYGGSSMIAPPTPALPGHFPLLILKSALASSMSCSKSFNGSPVPCY